MNSSSNLAISSQTSSKPRFAALRSRAFSFANTCSIGFEVRTVGGKQPQLGAGGANGAAHFGVFVDVEVVHQDHVPLAEGGHKELLDILEEAAPVHRLVQHARRVDPVGSQRADERHRLPMVMRHFLIQPLPPQRPAAQADHVGLHPGLVDEHQAPGVERCLKPPPALALARDGGTILLGRQHGFF